MKPKVLAWFNKRNLDPMNILQGELGLISDNAITMDEVAEKDIGLVHYMISNGEMERLLKL